MPLEVDQELMERWISIAKDSLPMESHMFDRKENSLKVLNQLLLPEVSQYVEIHGVEDGYAAIKGMIVRGAPLIATVGMLSLVVDLYHRMKINQPSSTTEEFIRKVCEECDYLVSARPTAVNLSNIAHKLKAFVRDLPGGTSVCEMREKYTVDQKEAEREENDLLIRNSVAAIAARSSAKLAAGGKLTVMTICNTGSLATSSYGTALGVVFHLNKLGLLEKAVALETRPYLQGSRLTAYELMESGVPFVLIADSMAAYAMITHKVDAVLVDVHIEGFHFVSSGADQVARNGDTANKIGTMDAGDGIRIEERPAEELTFFNGLFVAEHLEDATLFTQYALDKATAPLGCKVWNPAFDVTPARLITGILTEKGCYHPEELNNVIDAWK